MGFKYFLLVAAGGACGSLLRAFVSLWLKNFQPWPTLAVNLAGAFLIGLFVKYSENSSSEDSFRAFWIVGLCGGFTTFSAFGLDVFNFIKTGDWSHGLLYLSFNVLGTLLAIFIGFRVYSLLAP